MRVRLFAPLEDKVTSLAQSLVPFWAEIGGVPCRGYRLQNSDAIDLPRLLRARRERPRGCRAADERDERAPFHSITSSARASTPGGMVRPSALAVFRFITNSYLVGACTGRSAGFSPLRMRST